MTSQPRDTLILTNGDGAVGATHLAEIGAEFLWRRDRSGFIRG